MIYGMLGTAIRCSALDAAARQRAVLAAANEGQGIWTLAIVTEANVDQVRRGAAANDLVALRVLVARSALLNHPSPPPCLACGAVGRCRPPAAIVVLSAAVDVPRRLLVSAFCADCWPLGGTDAGRRNVIFDGLRQRFGMAGLRVLPPISTAGHA